MNDYKNLTFEELLKVKNEILKQLDYLYENATFEEYQEKGKELDIILKQEKVLKHKLNKKQWHLI